MGTLPLTTEDVDSDVYQTLGLKALGRRDLGTPRALCLLASLFEKSVQKNDLLLQTTQIRNSSTEFQGLRAPTVSIRHYIDRIFRYAGCSPSCFIVAHIYVDRFTQNTHVHLTSLNVHRLLITSVMIAAKFIDDAFFNNAYYAKVGGVSREELNKMEMKLLFSIDFRLKVNVSTFGRYCFQLEKEAAEQCQIERPIQVCRVKESWSSKDDSATCAPTIAR